MVIVKLTGGMGNQLFQYAMGRAVANRHNVPLKLDRHFLDNQPDSQPFARRNYALDTFMINAGRASAAEVNRYVPLAAYRPRFRLQRYGQRLIQRVVQALNPHYITEENADTYNPALSNAPAHCYLDGYWLAAHPEKIVLHPRHPHSADWAADGWIPLDTVFTPAR